MCVTGQGVTHEDSVRALWVQFPVSFVRDIHRSQLGAAGEHQWCIGGEQLDSGRDCIQVFGHVQERVRTHRVMRIPVRIMSRFSGRWVRFSGQVWHLSGRWRGQARLMPPNSRSAGPPR